MSEEIREVSQLLQVVKALLNAQELNRANYAGRLAENFAPISLFHPDEPDISRVLAFLLDPKESHDQGDLFLDAFCQLLRKSPVLSSYETGKAFINIPQFGDSPSIFVEYAIPDGRMDILIRNADSAICIENKPWSQDGKDQLKTYAQWLQTQREIKNWTIVYLSDHEPTEWSIEADSVFRSKIIQVDFLQLSDALETAAKFSLAPSVRYFVELFVRFLRQNVAGEAPMTDKTLLKTLKEPQNLTAAMAIYEGFPELRREAWNTFCQTLSNQCEERENFPLKLEYTKPDEISSSFAGFWFKPVNNQLNWCINFEAQRKNLAEFCWGVSGYNNGEVIEPVLYQELNNEAKKAFGDGGRSKYWPWWKWGEENPTSAESFPIELNSAKWLEMMLSGKPSLLTEMVWDKVDTLLKSMDKKYL